MDDLVDVGDRAGMGVAGNVALAHCHFDSSRVFDSSGYRTDFGR